MFIKQHWPMNEHERKEMESDMETITRALDDEVTGEELKEIAIHCLKEAFKIKFEGMKLQGLARKILGAHDIQGSLVQLYGTEAMLTGRTAMRAGKIFAKLEALDKEYNEAVADWNRYLEIEYAQEATDSN